MTIGENIKEIREQKGMSQAELSRKSGISCASISAYENGKWSPTVLYLQRIADALDVSTAYLRFKEDKPKPIVETVTVSVGNQTVADVTEQPKTERQIVGPNNAVRYTVKDKENLAYISTLIRNLPQIQNVSKETQKGIYRFLCDMRTELEIKMMFGSDE